MSDKLRNAFFHLHPPEYINYTTLLREFKRFKMKTECSHLYVGNRGQAAS